jgi:hypothetical protein
MPLAAQEPPDGAPPTTLADPGGLVTGTAWHCPLAAMSATLFPQELSEKSSIEHPATPQSHFVPDGAPHVQLSASHPRVSSTPLPSNASDFFVNGAGHWLSPFCVTQGPRPPSSLGTHTDPAALQGPAKLELQRRAVGGQLIGGGVPTVVGAHVPPGAPGGRAMQNVGEGQGCGMFVPQTDSCPFVPPCAAHA